MLAVDCDRCGRFKISPTALAALNENEGNRLSSVCRRSGLSVPIEILSTNVGQLLKSLPKFTPSEKLINLLQLLASKSGSIGEQSACDLSLDYPLLVLSNPQVEINFLLEELRNQGYIDRSVGKSHRLTMRGWERLQEIERTGRDSSRCFVAMWFDSEMDELYEHGVETAIHTAGYSALRIDKTEHTNRIDDEIIGQIKRSRFMVADFTGQRHGVYFEAGMMLGLGRNVIWMCRRDELQASKLHFDVRQFNFIDYESVPEARERLYRRILATEGEGNR